jgi:hypothetical protein
VKRVLVLSVLPFYLSQHASLFDSEYDKGDAIGIVRKWDANERRRWHESSFWLSLKKRTTLMMERHPHSGTSIHYWSRCAWLRQYQSVSCRKRLWKQNLLHIIPCIFECAASNAIRHLCHCLMLGVLLFFFRSSTSTATSRESRPRLSTSTSTSRATASLRGYQ